MHGKQKKLIVVLGQTAVGKTALSIKLAKMFNGEIVSADSRQVYKGLDIGTGKVSKKEMQGIPHHLIDVASPKRTFTIAQYKKLAMKAIEKIFKKGKIPFLVGGSPFYLRAVIEGLEFPKVKPDWELRKKLEKLSEEKLFEMLKKIDKERAKSIDKKNKRRLIRAIEIALKTKKPVPPLKVKKPPFEILIIGIKKEKEELKKLIKKRLLKRLKQGLVKEVKNLRKSGISWKRLESFGLEYKFVAQYLQGKLAYQEMVEKLQKEIEKFAKRQMTWFKKFKNIHWIKTEKEAKKLVDSFLNK